jgi:hypothetical protein
VISAAENSNKFQKTRFWKVKSVEDIVTLGPPAEATLVNMKSWTISNPKKHFSIITWVSITMVDESKSNHLVLLNLLEIKKSLYHVQCIFTTPKLKFHTIESLYLNQT